MEMSPDDFEQLVSDELDRLPDDMLDGGAVDPSEYELEELLDSGITLGSCTDPSGAAAEPLVAHVDDSGEVRRFSTALVQGLAVDDDQPTIVQRHGCVHRDAAAERRIHRE